MGEALARLDCDYGMHPLPRPAQGAVLLLEGSVPGVRGHREDGMSEPRRSRTVQVGTTIFDELGEPVGRGVTSLTFPDYRTHTQIVEDRKEDMLPEPTGNKGARKIWCVLFRHSWGRWYYFDNYRQKLRDCQVCEKRQMRKSP